MKCFTRISFLVCAAGVFALFVWAATFSYIGLDDAAYTFRNPFVAGGLSFGNVVEAFANFRHGGIWMPVTSLSYMLDASICRLTGLPLIGEMHVVNVFLHVLNFILLWMLLCVLFTPSRNEQSHPFLSTCCLFAAALWAVHPLRVEPVAWIAARKELLWTLFTLVGLICWSKASAVQEYNPQLSPSPHLSISTFLFCALACLSKPTAMCFPLLAGLIEWQLRRRGASDVDAKKGWRLALRYFPLILMAGVTAAIAAYSQTHVAGQGVTSLYEVPFLHRLVNAVSAFGFYIRATILPIGLHVDCRTMAALWPLEGLWNIGVAIVFLAVIGFQLRLKRPSAQVESRFNVDRAFLSFGWFILALFPTLGLFGSFGIEAHADRFAYLPSMAFSVFLVPFLSRPLVRWFACLALVVFSVLSFRQLGFWRDDATAYSRTLSCDPEHPRAMVHVADARCSRQRDFDGGIRLYRKALARADTVPKGGFDVEDVKARLAYALATRGRKEDFDEIKRLGETVLQDIRRDRRGMMLDALGTAFLHEGDRERAVRLFKASIEAPDRFWPKASTRRKLELTENR